jgi:hypothetical protein
MPYLINIKDFKHFSHQVKGAFSIRHSREKKVVHQYVKIFSQFIYSFMYMFFHTPSGQRLLQRNFILYISMGNGVG